MKHKRPDDIHSGKKNFSGNFSRRTFIAGMGAASILTSAKVINAETDKPVKKTSLSNQVQKERLNLGIIGFGFRGEQLARAMNFAHPDWIKTQEEASRKNSKNKVLADYYNQQDLDIKLSAVCDVYDERVKRGQLSGGDGTIGYMNYQEMLANKDVDAVVIATPDHWHAQMVKDAVKAGKHIYVEKCLTRTDVEAIEVRDAVKNSNLVFQLGHQGRQSFSNQKARELVGQGILGKVTLVETTTNRNNPFAAWVWSIPEGASNKNINWDLFEGPVKKKNQFSLERFFRWRCWYDYGTGMAGDLLTHDYDAVNQILNLGIPYSAISSGGIYFYKDGRDVPDVFQSNFEYPDKELTLIYSGTLANGTPRGTLIMGHDATIELGQSMAVWAEAQSTKYRSRIEAGLIDPNSPIVNYSPSQKNLDAITSATSKYFADRGLMYTYQNGRRVDSTNLHLAEWLNCIRKGGVTSCNIDQAFQEAITAHMATRSYLENRKVYWDPEKESII